MLLQQFADFLSLITIGMCFILKIPQILNLLTAKSANQISIVSLLLELTSYTVMTSYNFTNGYSVLSYLEYPIILFQEYILIFLVLKYLNKINIFSILVSILYIAISISLAIQLIPKFVLTILAPLCTPISVSSKIIQLLAIIRAKNADTVSPITWFISAFTNLTRVFTIWMDSADILLLGNFVISVILSSSIMFFAIYYKRIKQD
ncbi:PQ-loop repeat-containing protein 3 [Apis mellifera]|uniref:PQ-loop repeat-containing protein 3 n=1 Tax=Apis mellifera TaxID=7460 RepID=A0A7M7G2Y4_APIME|nr:PQ-loop repeat-containing protein 3 [Apis mellifera]XP_026299730.1 PQ-loop repeat-containing protein 3 [Apis mellifera]|eukprot:XP_001122178.2 PQ-loop repeat-containing protein 3 [Apis mellifera]